MGKTILIADAEQATASLVTSVLEGRGHRVVQSAAGKAVIDLVRSEQPELIIVGEQLDDIDGIGLIVKLRTVARTIKIVFISNQWREADLYKMLTQDYGVALVIHRPIKPLLFGAQIDSQLNTQKVDLSYGKEHERQAMLALRQRFSQALPGRLTMLSDALQSAAEQPGNIPMVQEARRLAHNIKGTAGSCGFKAVSEASAQLEKALIEAQQPERLGDESLWDDIELLFAQLRGRAETELEQNVGEDVEQGKEDANMAKILVVGNNVSTPNGNVNDAAFPVKLIPATAANALETASNQPLDAVLIDMETAGTPVAIAKELRSLAGHEALPLGFIKKLNHNGDSDRIETTHAGASLYLDAPLESQALRDGIEYLLSVRQGGRPRVLVVDDDQDFSSMIANTLGKEGMLVKTIDNPAEVLKTMESFGPDVLLLDVLMPGVSGFDVCRMLRANSRWHDTPIIFLTAQTELEARLAAFDAGGDDYLPKPVAPVELLTRVKMRLERSRFIRERADKDVLSGLLLRRAFMEQVESLLAEAARHDFSFTIALIDVDKFKNINDSFGHLAGDRVLAYLGALLKKRFRVEDIRGRWGGEEFIVAFKHETSGTTKGALERALEEFGQESFKGDHGEDFSVTFTAGLATYPIDGDTLERLVHKADERLYSGKEVGRNRIVGAD